MTTLVAPTRSLVGLPSSSTHHQCGVLVIGGGLAGLTAALCAADQQDVILLARVSLAESNSAWAQGGIAAALEAGDTPHAHVEDTLVAGAGLCDPAAVALLAEAAPGLMHELAEWGVPFERHGEQFALGLEGGHSHRRILHVGDATGWAMTQVLIARVLAHPRIRVIDTMQAVDLLGEEACQGVLACDQQGAWHVFLAGATILATGGAGALFRRTSNPQSALGEGIAMAYRAGAEVADMEFIQFHPTVFRSPHTQGFLITEAARGEGGYLRNQAGERFMIADHRRAELAPRDIVTRAIIRAMHADQREFVELDLTHLGRPFLEQRFPTIVRRLDQEGFDPAERTIPVAPAAHYLMGGIRTDLDGATSIPGLYAAGECACTGVHGANRLASNSLLECLVFGRRAGQAAIAYSQHLHQHPERLELAPPARRPSSALRLADLRQIMEHCAGPVRHATTLNEGLAMLSSYSMPSEITPETLRSANAALVAQLIMASALHRNESRGGHFRTDTPQTSSEWQQHTILRRGHPPTMAATIVERQPLTITL
ncbi:MAG: L-aspartate oxidase [Roseiflexaceae bacterium]